MSNTTNRPTAPQVQGTEGPVSTGLKAERIQSAPPTRVTRLKAERIQIALRDLPGWRLQRGARQIARTYEMADVHQVARVFQYLADLGFAGSPLPDVHLQQGAVTFTLPTAGDGWLAAEVFELAKVLEVSA